MAVLVNTLRINIRISFGCFDHCKGLGNGFPVGAVMTQGKAVGLLGPGSHGSTYGGTVLGSRVVLHGN